MKRFYLFLFVLFVAISLLSPVIALGISPGRTTINYEPGLEKEIEITIINNEHKHMNVSIYSTMQDNLSGTIALFSDSVSFQPSEEKKTVKYSIRLPDGGVHLEPGLHTGEIVALEVPAFAEGNTFVGATLAVVSQLQIYVPCPGKCIDVDMEVLDAEKNATATFIVPVINRGKVGIGTARAVIEINTFDYEKKATIETDARAVGVGERVELSAKWTVDLNPGSYLARITVLYDGESKSFEKQFTVGTKLLNIDTIFVNNFRLGEIAKLEILVDNSWNQELKSVFANLLVYNTQDQIMADIKSAQETVPALSKKTLVAYWDTVGVEEGEYDGKLMVVYGKTSVDKQLILQVHEESLDVFGVGYTIQPKGGRGIDMTTILVILVILLLVVNLAWFVFFRRFSQKK